MKNILILFSIVVVSFAATAQSKTVTSTGFQFGGGLRVGLPVGDVSDFSSFVLGAELQGEHMFSPTVSGTITTGYTRFFGKDFTLGSTTFKGEDFGYIPILAGIRIYPSPGFFIGGKAGISVSTESGGGTAFTYEPQIGYNCRRSQIALGYQAQSEDGSTNGHIGLTGILKFN